MSLAPVALVVGPIAFALVLSRLPPPYRASALLSVVPLHATGAFALRGGGDWLLLDGTARLALLSFDLVLAAVALRLPPWRAARPGPPDDHVEPLMAAMLGALSLAVMAGDLGLLMLGLLGTTLTTAPLVAWRQHRRAVEAAWRAGLVGLLGVALVLFGTTCLVGGVSTPSLLLHELAGAVPVEPGRRDAGFALLVSGALAIAGLAPVHGWRLAVAQEAPAPGAALVAAGLSTAGFVALYRVMIVAQANGAAPLVTTLVLGAAGLSLVAALAGLATEDRPASLIGWLSLAQAGVVALALGVGSGVAASLQGVQRDLLIAALWLMIPAGPRLTPTGPRPAIALVALLGLAGLGTGASSLYAVLLALHVADLPWVERGAQALLLGCAAVALGRVLPRVMGLARSADDLDGPFPAAILVAVAAVAGMWLPGPLGRMLGL